ncbi:hypothetical protein J6590_037755 [Homalodisca vitripennis]|nr:hypothetical protein J6590_037755 [Homalodisca vitripennis]
MSLPCYHNIYPKVASHCWEQRRASCGFNNKEALKKAVKSQTQRVREDNARGASIVSGSAPRLTAPQRVQIACISCSLICCVSVPVSQNTTISPQYRAL